MNSRFGESLVLIKWGEEFLLKFKVQRLDSLELVVRVNFSLGKIFPMISLFLIIND